MLEEIVKEQREIQVDSIGRLLELKSRTRHYVKAIWKES